MNKKTKLSILGLFLLLILDLRFQGKVYQYLPKRQQEQVSKIFQ